MSLRRWKRTVPKLVGRLRLTLGGSWRRLRGVGRWSWRRRRGAGKLLLLLALAGLAALAIRARDPARRAARKAAQARLHQENHQPEAALPYLAEAVELQPEEARYALEEAAALSGLGRHEAAEASLRGALQRVPGDVALEAALGQVLLRRGRGAEALALLAPLAPRVRTHPDASFACQALTAAAEAQALQGELPEAERLLREALSRRTPLGSPAGFELRQRARLGLVEVLVLQRRPLEAEAALRQGLAEAPDAAGLRLALARLLASTGRAEEAALLLEALVRTSQPPLRLDVAVAAVELRIRLGQGERALEAASALSESEKGVVTTYARGVIALARGEPAPARAAFEELATLLPSAARPLLLAARAAVLGAALPDARALLLRALEREPSDREVTRALLELEERLGDLAQVRARAEGLLEDPVLRALGVRTLFALHAREDDAKGGLARLDALAQRYPQDLTVQTYRAIFRILAGQVEEGLSALSALTGEGGLSHAFALMASAREGTSDSLEAIELLASLAERERAFGPARLVLGGIYERLGRLDLAVREVEAALAHDPKSTEARLERARLALRTEDVPRALAELEALKAAGTPTDRLLPLFDLLADRLLAPARDPRKDEVDLVVRLLQEVTRLAPERAAAHARLARALLLQGSRQPAREAWGRALELGPELVGAHGAAAIDLLEGKHREAAARLRVALSATGDPRFGAALSAALALEGLVAEARAALLPWLSVAGGSPEPRLFEAQLLALAGETQRAEAALAALSLPEPVRQAALRPQERPGELREVLEQFALLGLGLATEARERSARALTAESGPLLLWWAERALRQGGDPRLRVRLARRLHEVCGASREAALGFAEALTAVDELVPARDVLAALPRTDGALDPELDTRLGVLYQRLGQRDEARLAFERAIAAEPAPLVALNNLANLLGEDPARASDAVRLARRAWERGADRSETWDTLGWALFLAGQHEEAEAHLAWSATLSPANPTVRYHLARALVARGKPQRARNHLQLALMLGRRFDEGEAAQALLRELEVAGGPR